MSDIAKRPQFASVILLMLIGMTIAAIIGQTWWAVVQDKQNTLASEHENGLIAVRLLEEHANQTLQEADGNLITVIRAIHAEGRAHPLNNDSIRAILTKAQPFNQVLKARQFVNMKGDAYVSTIDYPAYQVDADDRTYIPFLLKHPEIRHPVIGQPFKRFYDAELVVPLARNLFAEDGTHLGIISTDISVSYFSAVYARVAKDSKAIVSLFSEQGVVIVRFPFEASYVGKNLNQSTVIDDLLHAPEEGHFEDKHFLDEQHNIARVYTYRKIAGYPIVSVFARDLDTVLAAWRNRTRDRVIVAGSTILLMSILTALLWLQIRRLNRSEASLRQSETSLRASEKKFVHLFQDSPIPLALIQLGTDRLVEVNNSLLKQSGFLRDELIGKTPLELNIWENYELRTPYLEQLRRHGYVEQMEIGFRNKNGQCSTCLLSSRLLEDGGNDLVIFTLVDITHMREIENEIRSLNAQLEERVSQRTQSLEEANCELANALKTMTSMQAELFRSEKMAALGSLVAGIAHELNTPIGNSVTVASTLQEHAETMVNELATAQPRRSILKQLTQETSHGADILMRSLNRAAQLILSFKQVAVDQSSDHRRQFDLSNALVEILLTLEPVYAKTPYRLHTELEQGIQMESYPGALAQILTNSITNAITHGFENKESGNMHLRTRITDAGQVEILFSDDGIGIPSQHIARVFDPFFTTKLGKGGSGLGMHIVFNLVTEVLGGKIELRSTAPSGTTLIMLFPQIAPHKLNEQAAA